MGSNVSKYELLLKSSDIRKKTASADRVKEQVAETLMLLNSSPRLLCCVV